MALQGNPFLGKLKIPAPDLSRIPETPFAGTVAAPSVSPRPISATRPEETSVVSKPETEKPKNAPDQLHPASRKKPKPPAPVAVDPAPVQSGIEPGPNRLQTASIGFDVRLQTASAIGFNRLQDAGTPDNRSRLKPNETDSNRLQTASETASAIGFKLPPIGELAVLRYLADREAPIGAPIPVRRREVAAATTQTLAGVKTALLRLSKARLIELVEFKRGKANGFTSYRLAAQARTVLASKVAGVSIGFKRLQTASETASNGFSSSSSSLKVEDLKTTTTSAPELFENSRVQLAPEWAAVDFSCVEGIGFTRHQLVQIVRAGALNPEEVRDSLAYFAFAYERGDLKKIRDPLGYLMSILRKPSTFPRPEGYETPLDSSRRKYLENKRRDEEQRQAEERELQDLEFAEWRRGVEPEKVNAIVPEVVRHVPKARESSLRAYFDENVWPTRCAVIPGAIETERAEIARQVEHSLGEARE